MLFTHKDPTKAYRGSFLWIPEDAISEDVLNRDLRFVLKGYRPGTSPPPVVQWERCGSHVRVPRSYPVPPGLEVVDLTPMPYQVLPVDDLASTFLDEGQERAYRALEGIREGILHLGCGRGKTWLGVKKAVSNGGPFLVIVDNTGTFSQWESAVREGTTYQDRIGLIQGSRMDIRPITFASARTLMERPMLPVETRHYFRTILIDEVHHYGSAQLKTLLPMFWGDRIGLSATIEREDGLEKVIYAHMGPVFYSDMSQPLTPEIYFKATHVQLPMTHPKIKDRTRNVNMSKMISFLGEMDDRNLEIMNQVRKARAKGRRILVLVHNVAHAHRLHIIYSELAPEDVSATLTGEVDQGVRRDVLREHPVVFATLQVGKEALDAPALDTIILGTPFKNWPTLQQAMGRALRKRVDKLQPIIVIINDVGVIPAMRMCRRLQAELTRRHYEWVALR